MQKKPRTAQDRAVARHLQDSLAESARALVRTPDLSYVLWLSTEVQPGRRGLRRSVAHTCPTVLGRLTEMTTRTSVGSNLAVVSNVSARCRVPVVWPVALRDVRMTLGRKGQAACASQRCLCKINKPISRNCCLKDTRIGLRCSRRGLDIWGCPNKLFQTHG